MEAHKVLGSFLKDLGRLATHLRVVRVPAGWRGGLESLS
jgi:hypothetical protein